MRTELGQDCGGIEVGDEGREVVGSSEDGEDVGMELGIFDCAVLGE